VAQIRLCKKALASFSFFNCLFNSQLTILFSFVKKSQVTLNEELESNAWISLSLSTINFTATD
jgi:hypothetical protein